MLLGDVAGLGAHSYGDRPAVVEADRRWSFREVHQRACQLANALLALAAHGDRVAILSQNRAEYVEAYVGVPMAGMALTFLNYRLAPRELARIIADAEASVVLVEPEHLATIAAIRDEVPSVRTVVLLDAGAGLAGAGGGADVAYEELLAGASRAAPDVEASEHDLAWLIYTSGTTGMPKGAMLSHRNVMTSVTSWMAHGTSRVAEDVQLMPFPLCHIAGVGVLGNLLLGTTLVLQRSYEPEAFLRAIEEHRVTGAPFAPTMLSMLLDHPLIDEVDLSSIRTIAYGGASMPVDVLRRAMARFPSAELVQGFGMTELAGNVLFLDPESHRRAAAGRPDLLAAAGRSMALSAIRLVDDDMHDVPVGEVGEIVVRGDQVMLGYWRRPEATEEAFAGGWFHTGDLGRADADGYVAIVDRKKDMIVTGGENVYSREVEEVIATLGVGEVAVVGVPDPHWGENVCAVVVRRPGSGVAEQDVIDVCRRDLAGYKKPKRVLFVDELPKNASGKVLKRQLRDLLVGEDEQG